AHDEKEEDYWDCVLWSDEKINVLGTDGFKTEYKEKWGILKRQVEHHSPTSIQALKEVVLEEWKKIDVAACRQLVDSMPRRLGAVLTNCGGLTKY
ncbi:unnamed protein product, partial [Staurois parvus]